MKLWTALCFVALGVLGAGASRAEPSVEIRHAAARVVVIPEARSDVFVNVIRPNPRLPIHVGHFAGRTYVDGGLAHRIRDCRPGRRVTIDGIGDVAYADLPQIVIHTPMKVRLSASEAVFGSIGRTESLQFGNAGCGDWTVANVRGHMELSQAGSGDTHAGSAGSAELRIAGSGDITTQQIHGTLQAVSAGSGKIQAASVGGDFNARVAGSGDVRADTGDVRGMKVSIAGSGDVEFGGVAQSLEASVVGSGDVRVYRVTGPVVRHMLGSGAVRVGQ
ncbi:MAG TPA: DUF2807 domain-containing protein [Caulobacteraceae bacterium]|nr:DUF2807 domain-containing protein [Caulobacteraceae bacterium]